MALTLEKMEHKNSPRWRSIDEFPPWTDGDGDGEVSNRIEARRYRRRFRGTKSRAGILGGGSTPSMIMDKKDKTSQLPRNLPYWRHGENRLGGFDSPDDSSDDPSDDESSLSSSSTPTIANGYATLSTTSTVQTVTTPSAALSGSADDPYAPQSTTSSTPTSDASFTTFTTSTIPSSQTVTAVPPIATAFKDGPEANRHAGLSPAGQKALIATGSIVGALILITVAWLIWRSSKRSSSDKPRVWKSYGGISVGPRRALSSIASKMPWAKSRTGTDDQTDFDIILERKNGSVSTVESRPPERAITAQPATLTLALTLTFTDKIASTVGRWKASKTCLK
ncbi:hypothetical protein PT974_05047 [Cladobotryum mycophilum]|uniref:Mid2 domain-containing protein n=1 Tax=Cladobotryum mycophilum TaxID=491253 RepID=A0ABR0SR20_9HYPO